MALVYQLDFWRGDEECKFDALQARIDKVEGSTEKVRKGMFARLGEQGKRLLDLESRMLILERNICRGG